MKKNLSSDEVEVLVAGDEVQDGEDDFNVPKD